MDEFRKRIQKFLALGESVQIVAPSGFGKSRFGKSLGGLYLDTNLLQTPLELLEAIKNSSERKLIVIDCLDHVLTPEYTSLYKYMKALRDQHKYQLAYVFLTSRPIKTEYLNLLGDLYAIVAEHVENLPVLDRSECSNFELTGGIPAFERICMLAKRDGTSLDPDENLKLKGQIEEMLAANPNHPAYANSSLMRNYKSSNLTAAESRLMDLLLANKGKLVSKNQICDSVYPDVKNKAGISDHSLDQLVHRLRSKIKDKYILTTHRGLGYKLS